MRLKRDRMDGIKARGGGTIISLEVHTNSKRLEFAGLNPWQKRFVLKVKAPPTGGKANKEIIKFLSDFFKIPSNKLRIVSGIKTTRKSIFVEIAEDAVADRLKEFLNFQRC